MPHHAHLHVIPRFDDEPLASEGGRSAITTVLVLGGIQLRAEGSQLHLAATDMEVSLRASVDKSPENRRPDPAARGSGRAQAFGRLPPR